MAHPRLEALMAECRRAWPLIEKDSTYEADRTRRAATVQMAVQDTLPPDLSTTADFLHRVIEILDDSTTRRALQEIVLFAENERRMAHVAERQALEVMHNVAHEAGFQQGVLYAQTLPAGIPEPMMN